MRMQNKTNYEWLGKEVVFEINSIRDEKIRRDAVWKIQTILREASLQDSEACSAATSPQPTTSRAQSAPQQSRFVFNHISPHPCNTSSSCTASPDILERSLQGILEEEDF